MPQFAITLAPSTNPAVTQHPPQRCNFTLTGSLNALNAQTVAPNRMLLNGYFRTKEMVPQGLYRSKEISVTALGQDITVDFYWKSTNPIRKNLANMYIDFYESPESEATTSVKSTLRLNSWEEGEDDVNLLPTVGARLLEYVDVPLYNTRTQYLMIDDPIDYGYTHIGGVPYTDEPSHGGKYVGDIALKRQLDILAAAAAMALEAEDR